MGPRIDGSTKVYMTRSVIHSFIHPMKRQPEPTGRGHHARCRAQRDMDVCPPSQSSHSGACE